MSNHVYHLVVLASWSVRSAEYNCVLSIRLYKQVAAFSEPAVYTKAKPEGKLKGIEVNLDDFSHIASHCFGPITSL